MARLRSLSAPMRWLLSVGLFLCVLLGWSAVARSDRGGWKQFHVCVNQRNHVRIVRSHEGCRPDERSVRWPPDTPEAEQGSSPGGALVVVDSAGKTIGQLIRPDAVAMAANGEYVVVGVRPDGLFGLLGVVFYFRELNCTGERLVTPSTDTLLPYLTVVGTTGYYGGRDSVPYAVGSMLYASSSASTPKCYNNVSPFPTYNLTPAKTFDLGGFTPPFSLK